MAKVEFKKSVIVDGKIYTRGQIVNLNDKKLKYIKSFVNILSEPEASADEKAKPTVSAENAPADEKAKTTEPEASADEKANRRNGGKK
jgi:hypothetical protein